jgi:hypothetical protein
MKDGQEVIESEQDQSPEKERAVEACEPAASQAKPKIPNDPDWSEQIHSLPPTRMVAEPSPPPSTEILGEPAHGGSNARDLPWSDEKK